MNTELKQLIEQADALLARFCQVLDRVEGIANADAPADPFADHPELPLETPTIDQP
jgi:hypothetical protein